MYFLGGMVSVVFGAIMPELLKHYQASYTTGGVVILLQAIGFMIGVPLASWSMNRFHYRFVLTGSALIIAIAELWMTTLPTLHIIDGLAVLGGIGASALETAVASYIMESFAGQRAILMSRLEVSFGLGALLAPAVASILITARIWQATFLLLVVVALLLAVVWQTVSVSLQHDQPSEQLEAHAAPPPMFQSRMAKYLVFSLFLFAIFVYVGLEGSVNSFMPSVFTKALHALPAAASLSVTSFWIAMVIGRLAIGWIARRVDYERYLLWSIVATTALFIFLALIHLLWTSYVFSFGIGLAMSAIYSITMVYANHTFPGNARAVTSLVTAFAGVGGAVFPAITGYAMDRIKPTSIPWMFVLFSVVLLCVMLCIVNVIRRSRGPANMKSSTS